MQGEKELQNFPADASFVRDKAPITVGVLRDTIKRNNQEKERATYEGENIRVG
jgi:hypothetical protein